MKETFFQEFLFQASIVFCSSRLNPITHWLDQRPRKRAAILMTLNHVCLWNESNFKRFSSQYFVALQISPIYYEWWNRDSKVYSHVTRKCLSRQFHNTSIFPIHTSHWMPKNEDWHEHCILLYFYFTLLTSNVKLFLEAILHTLKLHL